MDPDHAVLAAKDTTDELVEVVVDDVVVRRLAGVPPALGR